MNRFSSIALVMACAMFTAPTWAADPADHKAHHPETTAKSSKPGQMAPTAASGEMMMKMDMQMKMMRDMHDKMMNAKTPEERNALMADHMKAMQGGMAMMGGMRSGDQGDMKKGMPADMASCYQMMEKRMEMMETMMQMMMDRMPPNMAK